MPRVLQNLRQGCEAVPLSSPDASLLVDARDGGTDVLRFFTAALVQYSTGCLWMGEGFDVIASAVDVFGHCGVSMQGGAGHLFEMLRQDAPRGHA
jgi:hypothetical protein